MKIAILAVTRTGAQLANKIKYYLDSMEGYSSTLYFNSKIRIEVDLLGTENESGCDLDRKFSTVDSFSLWMKENFHQFDGLICIMATGIVTRLIAPYLIHKSKDPAVVVLDEKGQFAISLISGHLGGANELAELIANGIEGQAVITTATDVQGKLAIDIFARKNNLYIEDTNKIKLINSLLLQDLRVDLYSQYPLYKLNRDLDGISIFPLEELTEKEIDLVQDDVEAGKRGLVISTNKKVTNLPKLPTKTMLLRPINIIVGIGCRRGVGIDIIEEAVLRGLDLAGLDKNSILNLASIDIKEDEIGLLQLAEKWNIPLRFYSRDEIDKVIQSNLIENLSVSEFVHEKIGVGGVCEPVIVLSNQDAQIVLPKMKWQGVTVAIGVVPSM